MRYYIILTIFLFLSCRPIQITKNSTSTMPCLAPNPVERLHKNINNIINDSLFVPSQVSIKVVSLENDEVLFEHKSKILMHPASNVKLFTAASALYFLDTNYLFNTSVYIDSNDLGKNIIGNIYLKGFGNPDFCTSDMDSIVQVISQMGITNITGNIVIDDSYFDDVFWGPGWMWDDETEPDAPYINALSINKNCISITAISDSNSLIYLLEPVTNYVQIINNAKVRQYGIQYPFKINCIFLNNLNTIILNGNMPIYSQSSQKFSLKNPEIYAGYLFKESLKRAGIFVAGEIAKGQVFSNSKVIVQHYQSIETVITNLKKNSDNLSAENIIKILGVKRNGIPGSTKNGISALKEFISNIGIDTTKLSIVDGSGISRYNLINTEQIVQLLTAVYRMPRIFPVFYNSLPIAGVDGTLAFRLNEYPVLNNLRAKTGTLRGVSCLSGYVQTRDGEMLAFSIMMQNFINSATNYRNMQDKLCVLLAYFSRRI